MKSATRIKSRCAGGLRLRLKRLLMLPRPFVFIVGTFGEPTGSESARGLRPEYGSGAVGGGGNREVEASVIISRSDSVEVIDAQGFQRVESYQS